MLVRDEMNKKYIINKPPAPALLLKTTGQKKTTTTGRQAPGVTTPAKRRRRRPESGSGDVQKTDDDGNAQVVLDSHLKTTTTYDDQNITKCVNFLQDPTQNHGGCTDTGPCRPAGRLEFAMFS